MLFQDGVCFSVKEYEEEDRTKSMTLNNYTQLISMVFTAAINFGEF